jgi:hypothetical protein
LSIDLALRTKVAAKSAGELALMPTAATIMSAVQWLASLGGLAASTPPLLGDLRPKRWDARGSCRAATPASLRTRCERANGFSGVMTNLLPHPFVPLVMERSTPPGTAIALAMLAIANPASAGEKWYYYEFNYYSNALRNEFAVEPHGFGSLEDCRKARTKAEYPGPGEPMQARNWWWVRTHCARAGKKATVTYDEARRPFH